METYTAEEQRKAADEFTEELKRMKKNNPNVMERFHFDVYGNNSIRVSEFVGEKLVRTLVKVDGESSVDCFLRAAKQLRSLNKETEAVR